MIDAKFAIAKTFTGITGRMYARRGKWAWLNLAKVDVRIIGNSWSVGPAA
jgi:hypothetical protein